MLEEKRQIILDEGLSIQVLDHTGAVLANTKAIIGRASTQNFEMRLEHYRRMQFLPDAGATNGCIVRVISTNEDYLILATMNEVIHNQHVAVSAIAVSCNAELRVEGIQEKADKRGNISKIPVVKAERLKSHVQLLTADLKQYDPGLHQDAEYRIYAPLFDIDILDQVTMYINGKSVKLKVVAVYYTQFDGIVTLEVKTETRK